MMLRHPQAGGCYQKGTAAVLAGSDVAVAQAEQPTSYPTGCSGSQDQRQLVRNGASYIGGKLPGCNMKVSHRQGVV